MSPQTNTETSVSSEASKEELKSQVKRLQGDLNDLENYVQEFNSFLPLAVCIINPANVVINVNNAFTSFTKYEEIEAVGKSFSDFFVENNPPKNLLDEVKNAEEGFTRTRELTLLTANSKKHEVKVTASLRRNTEGEYTGHFVGISDISNLKELQRDLETRVKERTKDLKTAQSRLKESFKRVQSEQQKTEAVINSFTDGLLVVNNSKEIEIINPRASEMLEVEASRVEGENIEKLEGENIEELEEVGEFQQLLSMLDRHDWELERQELQTDPDVFLEVSTVPMKDKPDGGGMLITLHDISHEKMVEQMKLEFASVAAHQMRTPLSAIRWSFELLTKQLDGDKREVAQRGFRSTERILEIINDLLNVDRIESGKSAYSFEAVDVVELIDAYVDEVRKNSTILNQANVHFETPSKSIPDVRADKEKLRIVVRNLVENALKYTPEDGSVDVRVELHMTDDRAGDSVRIIVSDTGIGIPESEEDKIFSKFYRADNATAKETDGTGIGLFITKHIVENHDGKIWFESEEGEGTDFFVQIPTA